MKKTAALGRGDGDGQGGINTHDLDRPKPPSCQLHRAAEHLHQLGPRPVFEALKEVASGADLDQVLSSYARFTPDLIQVLGGDRFAPPPLHIVVGAT